MGFGSGGGPRRQMGFITDEEAPDSTLGLGELAQLTVSNEAEQFGVSVSDLFLVFVNSLCLSNILLVLSVLLIYSP